MPERCTSILGKSVVLVVLSPYDGHKGVLDVGHETLPLVTVTDAVAVTLPDTAVTVSEPAEFAVNIPLLSMAPIDPDTDHVTDVIVKLFPYWSSPETVN